MNDQIDISIVVPVYNEGPIVHNSYDIIMKELIQHAEKFEIIFVDDGSVDDTFAHLEILALKDNRIKLIKLSSNCGSHMAIRAGLSYAVGRCACFIACDMQEPPYLIYKMKAELSENYNIVWAVRNSRKDSVMTIIFAKLFYWMARKVVTHNIPPSGASMFMISDKVLTALNQYEERNLTLEGLFATMGFKSAYIYYERKKRIMGNSKWTLSKKLKLFIDFFIAYSNIPIRFVSLMGIFFSIIGFFWSSYIIFRAIISRDLALGWPALISILLVGFGVTNISLGVIAEYLWRTLDEARKRPKYIIEKLINIE
ncbi:glycosyltransferase, group 2 family protein [Leptospira noguchii str. 1993005606]|uniref:Glycosyltransferase, group 2 family protein n=2 Tax=Leptospira noguchii TaxID=28182 RepID=M6YFD0_9LEPT|nr:glycosyltransferase family 2 protein [Leptospira noguchii]EMN01247.1 glycosyltransferase, group 2 family protein [Leptospira noguchii str. 2007001578]EMO88354.1 glycosyltransferase, group 2 family protein [Leptospira noguchii str. 2001034031]EPE84878.1 glycosyltransferase, group 2 family protein [Leptospira noguchii str. 1993005606]